MTTFTEPQMMARGNLITNHAQWKPHYNVLVIVKLACSDLVPLLVATLNAGHPLQ